MINIYTWNDGTYISHHGILGQKWGVRRYQNKDGSLTNAGRRRYGNEVPTSKEKRWAKEKYQPSSFKSSMLAGTYMAKRDMGKSTDKIEKKLLKSNAEDAKKWEESKNKVAAYNNLSKEERTRADKQAKIKKTLIIGGTVVAAGLATYGALKTADLLKDKAYTKTFEAGKRATENLIKKYSDEIYDNYVNALSKYGLNSLEMKKYRDVYKSQKEYLEKKVANLATNTGLTAEKNSKNIKEAIKTLAGNNAKTAAELEEMGIQTIIPDYFNYEKFRS